MPLISHPFKVILSGCNPSVKRRRAVPTADAECRLVIRHAPAKMSFSATTKPDRMMSSDDCKSLVEELQTRQLLSATQVAELNSPDSAFADAESLAGEMVRKGWLTSYQSDQVLAGRADDLILGPYVVLDLLGQGGMGRVFKARHRLMNRDVAIKLIRPELLTDAAALARFQREIQALAKLSHPNLVLAYHADHVGTHTFLVMEYVEGTTLEKLVTQ